MKYNVPLVIQDNDSLSMLLKHIDEGSVVLEFGCANGRMTKYMKEVLNCKVYIVEYEQAAFDEAMQYAVGGYCGDIMEFQWTEKFKDIQFDYIVFADVLEHLYNPWKVLCETKKVLKDEGSVLVSLPNVGHNDIVAQLFKRKFNYTPTGLLDDTHIRFFTENSLALLCEKSGYKIVSKECTTVDTGKTEQFVDLSQFTSLEKALLYTRKNGTIFQFILELKKQGEEVTWDYNLETKLEGRIYFDYGDGFSEETYIPVCSVLDENQNFVLDYTFENEEKVKKIRFDPVEGMECLVFEAYTMVDGKRCDLECNAIDYEGWRLMDTLDPYLEYNGEEKVGIGDSIYCKFIIPGEKYITDVMSLYNRALCDIGSERDKVAKVNDEMNEFRTRYEEMKVSNEQLVQSNTMVLQNDAAIQALNQGLSSRNTELENLNASLVQTRKNLEQEIFELQGKLDQANKNLNQTRENLSQEIFDLQADLESANTTRENLSQEVLALKSEKEQIENSTSWKLTSPLRWIGSIFK